MKPVHDNNSKQQMVTGVKVKPIPVLIIGSALIAVAAYQWAGSEMTIATTPDVSSPQEIRKSEPETAPTLATPTQEEPAVNDDLEAFRERLMARFEGQLDHPGGQVRLLGELMRYLNQFDPEHWRESLSALLLSWFPDRGEELLNRAEAMIAYQDFMEQQQYTLRSMGPDERRDFIWAKRRELFGDAADDIWQSELRNYSLSQSLKNLDQQPGPTLAKAEAYTRAIQDAYGDEAARVMERRRQELTDRFLSLTSVQQSLHEQAPEQRYETLRGIRQQLGMEEQALDRWDQLDRSRDNRWSQGENYETKRQAIVEKYQPGPEREEALDSLSQDIFGDEMAAIIRDEEAAGYFRFQESRIYGQN
ncbi:hypothetical protein DET50_12030 [Marinobacter pelagius]|uniref:Lipase modulator n=1 Tax=Marinobacter pelagius TaxID=379482 RepID=A0A366GGK2_9GAMM|nr:hypothetical protein DET50_12030 [Marinobacter pelagius]